MSVKRTPSPPASPWPVVTIHSGSPYSTNHGIGTGSQAYPTANKAFLYPFVVPEPITAYKLGWYNGLSPTGNADIGIYDAAGNRLVSSGTTARSGSNAVQVVDIADTNLTPGTLYYLAYAQDDTSAWRVLTANGQVNTMVGVREKATSFVLPSTITGTSGASTNYVLLCFVEGRSRA